MLSGHTSEHDAIQQGIPTKTIVAMDTTCHLTSGIQSGDGPAIAGHNSGIHIDFQASHAIMDHWRDDCDIEWFTLHGGTWDDVVVELFPRACLATRRIPRLARWVSRVRPSIGVLLGLLCCLVVLIVGLHQGCQGHSHVLS